MLHIHLLGTFAVTREGEPIDAQAWGRRKTASLLKYFAAHRGQAITQEQLLEALYPEQPNEKSLRNLLGRISELRRALEPGLENGRDSRFIVRVGRGTYTLPDDAPCTIDIETFREEVVAGIKGAEAKSWHEAIRRLERGVGLYRGEFLGEDVYEEWTISLRSDLEERLRSGLHTLGLALRTVHAFAKAIEYYDRAIALDPLDEVAYRGKMLALYHGGDPAGAEGAYDACARQLADYDLEPDGETRALYEAVLERALAREVPPVRNNLPRYAAPFFGREGELSRILDIVAGSESPVLTLLGPGGIGKTRMAVEAAGRALEQYDNGVFLVAVPAEASADRLLGALAEAADIQLEPGEEPRAQLLRSLHDKRMLFVLDDAEYARGVVDVLEEIVQQTNVQIIAASRQRLGVSGEKVFEVAGLGYFKGEDFDNIDVAELASYEASQLFRDRMRRVDDTFDITAETAPHVARICRITEGMPLAIELAATWGRVLSCAEIARGLAESAEQLESNSPDTPRQHRSMRAVFEHTWDRLSPDEQTVFARLSVFRGGMSTAAALEIGGGSVSMMMSLRDMALIQRMPSDRCAVHELLRQFGGNRLARMASERDAAHDDHARYFTNLVARHTDDFFGPEQTQAQKILHADAPNILAAWERNVAVRNYTALRHAARGLFQYYKMQTNWHELHMILKDTLHSLQGEERTDELEHVLALSTMHKGVALTFGSDLTAGMQRLTQALELARHIGDRLLEGECLIEIGIAQGMTGDYDEAEQALTEGLKILRELRERHATGRALTQLGVLHRQRRQYDEALATFSECLETFRELGDAKETAGALLNLGTVYGSRQQWPKARELFEESLEIARKAGQRHLILMNLANIGYLAYLEQDFPTAEQTYRQAWEFTKEHSNLESRPQLAYYLCLVYTELGEYGDASHYVRDGLATATQLHSPPLILRNVYALGRLLHATDRLKEAAGLMRFALNHPATPAPTKVGIEADFKTLQKDLTPEIAEGAEQWANSLSLEDVVEWAMTTRL